MTDVECIDEAIKNIGGTVVGEIKQNQDITIKINNKNWTLKKQTGRYALTHMSDQNVSWVNNLRNQYNIAEHNKREAELKAAHDAHEKAVRERVAAEHALWLAR